MKAVLEFNLPEEAIEHKTATQAGAMSGSISEFYNFLRAKKKYFEFETDEARELAEEIFTEYCEEMGDYID